MRVKTNLKFSDVGIEAAFLADYPVRARRQLRIAFAVMIVASLVFLPQDSLIDPINGRYATMVRLFAALPLALIGLGLTFVTRLDRFAQIYIAVIFLGLAIATLQVLYFLDAGGIAGYGLSSSTGLSNVTLLIIFAFAVSTLRFIFASLIAILISVSYFAYASLSAGFDTGHFLSADFSNILLVMIVGGFIGAMRELYLRKDFLAQLRLEERFKDLVEGSIQGILVQVGGKPLFANQAFADILEFQGPVDVLKCGSIFDFFLDEDRNEVIASDHRVLAGEEMPREYLWRAAGKGRAVKWLECLITRVHWGDIPAVQYTVIDVSDRKRVEDELARLSQAIEQSPIEILTVSLDGRVEYVNRNFIETTGFSARQVIGNTIRRVKLANFSEAEYNDIWQQVRGGEIWEGEVHVARANGNKIWEHILISAIRDEGGAVSQLMVAAQDISIRKVYEERLLHQAYYDQLTDLPNRILAFDRLVTAINRAQRRREMVGVMFIDLDRFKKVNDMLGHKAGDELLQMAAERLALCGRAQDTLARLGGDEFAAVLPDLGSVSDAESVAKRFVEAFAAPFVLENHDVFVTASIGISIYPLDGDDATFLMRNADAAMYEAKKLGRNGYQFFTANLNAEIKKRVTLEQRLRQALDEGQFELHFQPRVRSDGEVVSGAEALIRWRNIDGRMESPAEFIPLAEDTGLILPIGRWVLETAIDWIAGWWKLDIGPSYVAVNVSPRQFTEEGFVDHLLQLIRDKDIPAEALEVEITESLLIDGDTEVIEVFNKLKAAGVRLSIDDFGTGYSALSYLKKYPFDTLKIDAAFVREVTRDKDDQALIQAIVAMAHSLRLEVVAEGVETAEQLAYMRRYKCDVIQGYYYGKAMPAAQFEKYITDAAPSQNVVKLPRRL